MTRCIEEEMACGRASREMWAVVFRQAVADLVSMDETVSCAALAWFMEVGSDDEGSFLWVCELFGLSPDAATEAMCILPSDRCVSDRTRLAARGFAARWAAADKSMPRPSASGKAWMIAHGRNPSTTEGDEDVQGSDAA